MTSAAISDIYTTAQLIRDNVEYNKDDFFKTVNLLQMDLINPMQKENNDKKKVATTQTRSIQPESSTESSLL